MVFNLTYAVYAAILYILYSRIRNYLKEQRFRKWAKENGAVPVQRSKTTWLPYGLENMLSDTYRIINGADILDEVIVPYFFKNKASTIETRVWGLNSDVHIIETYEGRIVQAVLATQFEDFDIGEMRHRAFRPLLGQSIFTSDGAFWSHSRGLFRPVFNRESINDLEETNRASNIMIDVLSEGSDAKGWTKDVNLLDHFYQFTMDTSTAFLFGETTDTQLAAAGKLDDEQIKASMGTKFDQGLSDDFRVAQEWLQWRMVAGSLYWVVKAKKWRQATENVLAFVDRYVQTALGRKGKEDKTVKYNLLSELVTRCHDPNELRDQTLALLGAGRDTTAALLAWVWVELALNPDFFAKLRAEVLETFPNNGNIIDFGELKSCKLLQYTMNETLRLHPPVPMNSRQANKDTILPCGGGPDGSKPIAVRKDQIIAYCVYQIHRRRDIWGEDADKFKPERWSGRKIDWNFVPFSGGPRICLGQQYALTEASYLTVKLLQAFDGIEWAGGEGQRIGKGFTLTMAPGIGTPVRLRRAKA